MLIALVVLLCLGIPPVFGHLDEQALQLWDEARLAVNALEMHLSGDWIVTTFADLPDHYNTKPPFCIWLMSLSYKLFGINVLAVRMPSAIFGLLTAILLFWFFSRKNKLWAGLYSALILLTSTGYVALHNTRTGDYDSVLCFFTTANVLLYFIYVDEGRQKYLLGSIVSLTLGVLTKGVVALIFVPALLILTAGKWKLLATLRAKNFYLGIIFFFLFGIGYYFLREYYDPGYINAVKNNELGGRFANTLEGHRFSRWFYYDGLFKGFNPWVYFLLPAFFITIAGKDKWTKGLATFLGISCAFFFAMITIAETKLPWYSLPMFPLMAMIVGVGLHQVVQKINSLVNESALLPILIPAISLVVIFFLPYNAILKKSLEQDFGDFMIEDKDISAYLDDGLMNRKNIDGQVVCWKDYKGNITWYLKALQLEGKNVKPVKITDIQPGQIVVTFQEEVKEFINSNYKASVKEHYRESVAVFQILQ
jgi:4-amino-4-deoxy-L-arabinose transferase-like glycosyltransferase